MRITTSRFLVADQRCPSARAATTISSKGTPAAYGLPLPIWAHLAHYLITTLLTGHLPVLLGH